MDWFLSLFGGKDEAPPEPLVLGAELWCPYGSEHNFLRLETDDIDINNLPKACVDDCKPFINIKPFGVCYGGSLCELQMDLEEQWENPEPQNTLANGKQLITTKSILMCRTCGMTIEAVTSGQDGVFANRLALYSEMEDKYPGLLTILRDPYGSLYLNEGMYKKAIRFLEDRINVHGGELFLPTIYDINNPEGELIKAVLERLIPYGDSSSFDRFLNGLETAGSQNNMDKIASWDPRTLNKAMIVMLRRDCKKTAERIETDSFARWTEEHKLYTRALADGISQFAYGMVVYRSMAEKPEKYVEGEGGSETQTITNKFPNDNQQGKTFNYTMENGKIKIENGIQKVDFVIDMDGNLYIGRGHSYLAEGNPVQAAGQLKVNAQGYIRSIVNDSGHYQPSVAEALNYPEILRNVGLNIDNAWITIDEFVSSTSNYVIDSRVFYNGPVQYMPK